MSDSAKVLLSFVMLVLLYVSPAGAQLCPLGDITGDCRVNSDDLAIFAEQWMTWPECSGIVGCANLDDIEIVDMKDWALFAADWLKDERAFTLKINEFMASNNSASDINDPQGHYDDWIEIYNSGQETLDLGGMYITDDLDEPLKWRIPGDSPAETTVDANGFLLFWADGDTPDGPLHVGFKLSADGEQIGLVAPDGNSVVDSITFAGQATNISMGRWPDGNDAYDAWRFMATPTPAAENNDVYLGLVGDTEFSHNRGFYDAQFNAVITCETGSAMIYYTTDGNAPIENEMPTPSATLYTGPIPIMTTTCLRAAAIKTGWIPTNVDAQTYIFLDDVKDQSNADAYNRGFPVLWDSIWDVNNGDYAMDPAVVYDAAYESLFENAMKAIPTMSLSMKMYDLFDKDTGVYVNYWKFHDPDIGEDWERPVSMEFFDPCTGEEFQVNCGIRLIGNDSRNPKNPKHSLRLTFTSEYGPTRLDYPFFDNTDVDRHNTISLRCQYHDSWFRGDSAAQLERDMFAQESIRDMGYLSPDSKFVHLYINGLYWGLYQASERPDDAFMAEHLGSDPDDYEVVEGIIGAPADGVEYKGDIGDQTWSYIWNYITAYDYDNPITANEYEVVKQYIDVTQMVDYIIYMTWACNWDWNSKNWYAASMRGGPTGPPAGKWQFYPWDSEITLGWWGQMQGFPFTGYYGAGPGLIHNALHNNPEYNRLFGDRVHKLCRNGGAMTLQKVIDRYEKRSEQMELAMIAESARWGDYRRDEIDPGAPVYTLNDHWAPQRSYMTSSFFPNKVNYVIGAYKGYGLYPNVTPPTFNVNGSYQHGGYISSSDTISMTGAGGTVFYTLDGNDVIVYEPPGPPPPPVTILVESAAKKVLVPTSNIGTTWKGGSEPYDDSGWNSGIYVSGKTGGVGFDKNTTYVPYISYDVKSVMSDIMGSCYVRIPFTVDGTDLAEYTSLKLRLRFEDGFVAYINGAEAARYNAPSSLEWNSNGTALHSDGEAVNFTDFIISSNLSDIHAGTNILAIQGLNTPHTSSDFLISAVLEAGFSSASDANMSPGTFQYSTPFTLAHSAILRARALDDPDWSALNEAVYAIGNLVGSLRVSEFMYHPKYTGSPDDANTEYVELTNIGTSTINLNLVRFTKGIDFTFGPDELAAGQRILVVKDEAVFKAKYGTGRYIAGQYTGSLDNGGERIRLEDAIGTMIADFRYSDGWRETTDGEGYSLTIINPTEPDPNSWSLKDCWRPSAYINGSPGWDDSGLIPNPGAIVINEVMTHTDVAPDDWIELYNTTAGAIDISGWFLSDSDTNVMKYEFGPGTVIGAYDYLVLFEDVNFGSSASDPGKHVPFALSENGELVRLSSALDTNGVLTGYHQTEDFGASENGVSFGRYYKTSTDNFNFVAMSSPTSGSANAYPKVGPVVITEIMYHPDWPDGTPFNNDEYEYIELYNSGGSAVTLYDYTENESWKFTDGIDYTFPAPPDEVAIPPGGHILIVKNPAAFHLRYSGIPVEIICGPYTGWLNNDGEKLELSKPGGEYLGTQYYIRVERVNYSDGSHPDDEPGDIDPWPTEADGLGSSLIRDDVNLYANDPNNWTATP